MAQGRSGEEAVRDAVANLRLGRWDEIRGRLLARLVPRERAGPLHVAAPALPGTGVSPVVLDVGIEVSGGIVRVDDDLAAAWEVAAARIWATAASNLDRLLQPPTSVVADGPVRLRVVAGGPWTTGLLLRPERLADRGPTLVAAPLPGVLVLADRGPQSAPTDEPVQLVSPLLALAQALAQDGGRERLPLTPLLVVGQGSFPARWILE